MANAQASTIIGLARTLLRSDDGSDVPAIQNDFMLASLSDANLSLVRAFRRGSGEEPIVFQRETGFTLVADTELAEDVTSASTDFDVVNSSGFDPEGAVVLWDGNIPDITPYDLNTANNFSGSLEISFDHELGDQVQKLYPLPGNFGTFRRADGYGDGVSMNGLGLKYMNGPPQPGYFSVVEVGTTKFLWFYRGASGKVSVWYDKASTVIDDLMDTVDVGPECNLCLAWKLVELATFGRGDAMDRHLRAQQKASEALLSLLKDRNIGKYVRVRPIRSSQRFNDPSLYLPSA